MTISKESVEVTQEEIEAVPEFQRIETIASLQFKMGDKPVSPRAHKLFAALAEELHLDITTVYGSTLNLVRAKTWAELHDQVRDHKWVQMAAEERKQVAAMAEKAAEREADKQAYFNGVTEPAQSNLSPTV